MEVPLTNKKKVILVSVVFAIILLCCTCGCIWLLIPFPINH